MSTRRFILGLPSCLEFEPPSKLCPCPLFARVDGRQLKSNGSAIGGRLPAANDPLVRPLLICEVLSPGSGRHDRLKEFFAGAEDNAPL